MNLKIISANINGIRSAQSKGFFDWINTQNADIICLQEVRADHSVLEKDIFRLKNYQDAFVCAEKKGYSGVGIYAKKTPQRIIQKFNHPLFDREGRFIAFEYDDLLVASIYLHSGTTGTIRQDLKYQAMNELEKQMNEWQKLAKKIILCGDINIVHSEKDIKNFKQNQQTSGCLPEERAWLNKIFYQMGWVDSFREIEQKPDQYTWWSNRGQAYAKNVGWRIDYQILSSNLKGSVKQTEIYKGEKFSDHAPYSVQYQL